MQSINEDYARQLLELERQRLERLGQLAAHQPANEAAETYEELFRLAIANNLFREAEPAAREVLKSDRALRPPVIQFLARTIDIIASADRGAYDESLADLHTLIEAGSKRTQPGEAAAASLDTSALLAICEAYYQRLLQGDQFDVARKAFQMLLKESDNPAVKGFSAGRLNQLEHDRQAGPGDSRDRSRWQAGEPGRLERRRGSGRFLGKLVRSQFGRGRRSRSGLQRAQGSRVPRGGHQCRHAPGRSAPSSRPSCPTSGDSCWIITSAGPI